MSRLRPLPRSFYRRDVKAVASDLLGRFLVRRWDDRRLVLKIVETEAYLGAEDRASHACGGRRTARTRSLFRAGGYAYVYFIYGMYYCLNAVAGSSDDGSAVLIRACEAIEGASTMRDNRRLQSEPRPGDLAGGPGKLCQALAIDLGLNGVALDRGELRITTGEPMTSDEIVAGPRVGVAYSGEASGWPLRFAWRGHPEVSRPHPW